MPSRKLLPHHLWLHLIGLIVAFLSLAIFGNSLGVEAQTTNCSPDSTMWECIVIPTPANSAADLTVTVSASIPETAINLQGYSAPGAFVIVSKGSDVVGASTADVNGEFNFSLTGLQAGTPHSISIMAASDEQITPSTGFVVTPVANSVITVSNIVLPPFIKVTPSAADLGDPIVVSGEATPGATLNMFISPPLQSSTITVASDGTWSVELIGTFGVLANGVYNAYAYQSVGSYQSDNSQTIPFEVREVQSSTFLTVNGYGPPGGFLTFKNGNTVVGSGIVDPDGTFSNTISFPDADATITMNITVDDGDQVTPVTSFTTNLVSTETTTVDDVLLPTFITVNPLIANVGSAINVDGTTTPDAEVELQITSPTQTTTIVAASDGTWNQELLSVFGNLPQGVYKASAVASIPAQSLTSVRSQEITFTVTEVETATDLVVEGYGAPGAFMTFTENNLVIGTAVIPSSGAFTHTLKFSDQTLPHTISIVADNGSQQTPPTTFTVTVTALSSTTVSNIVLPTFIDVPKTIPYGNSITATGTGAPNALVQVFVRTPLIDKPVTTDATGKWQLDLNTIAGALAKGKYTVYARTTILPQSYQSGLSRELEFEVTEADQCAERRSDLNCDSRVDITDLGILIFYWGAAGAGQKADINKDSQVSIQDVGIMVYDWTY